ncbi:acetolactate synthase [Tianweitania populi]|uniref:Acetolactate synthase n=2 Tax=Tianweitania populi TaxID=1607949 RepID=A0A8J3GMW8_9HYPH|nr:thiamine pyrophosphate-binding protein [Tianweitania populi]GHD22424.1 acetolactate synthase [Tianweitania populi]
MHAIKPVFELLAQSLHAHGVTELFGLIGDANLYMVDAWVRADWGRYTACAHEATAVLAALGYAQVSGLTGVATITHGPALTNAMTALAEGAKGGIPVVLLCGDTAPHDREHLQKIDQRELVKATGAGFVDMRTPDTASSDLARAFRQASLERRPVVFNMRADLQWEKTAASPVKLPIPVVRTVIVEGDAFDEALGAIASAKRPLILAGRGAIAPDVKAALLRLAARLEAPVATTLKASGLFHGAPFDLGVLGTLARPVALETLLKSDCVIAFGASLSRLTTDNGKLLDGKRVIQILGDPLDNDRRTDPGMLLIADPASMADKIVEMLDLAEIAPSGATDADLAEALSREAEAQAQLPPTRETSDGTIDYEPALRRIHQALPCDRVLVTDLGRFVVSAWRNLPVSDPRHLVYTANFASIGCGLGEAIGAARAAPDKLTVLVAGDGGFTMGGLTELSTVVREKLNLAIILCNDGSYGAEHIQFTNKGMSPALSMTSPPDFTGIARAMGMTACKVPNPAELEVALKTLTSRNGPSLIELSLDPEKVFM